MPGARPLAFALLAATAAAGCGSGATAPGPPTAEAPPPALASRPPQPGELVFKAEGSPKTFAPVALHGRYLARFAQYDPTDPGVDFAEQTSFVARLVPVGGGAPLRLFRRAAPAGETTVRAEGRYRVDVPFGDFPFAIRLTPRNG